MLIPVLGFSRLKISDIVPLGSSALELLHKLMHGYYFATRLSCEVTVKHPRQR
jgi:hypothetical protein